MRTIPTRWALPLAVASALAMPAAAPPAMAAPQTHTIVIERMHFGPVPANLRTGDTIVWVNRDIFRHTATARDRSFNVDLAPGARGRTVLRRNGAILFYCIFHPGMTGRLAVR
jgi:plastocyanin